MVKVEKLEMTQSEKLYHKLFNEMKSIMSEKDEENSFINNNGYGKVFIKTSYVLIKNNTIKIINKGDINNIIIMRIKNVAESMNFEVIE